MAVCLIKCLEKFTRPMLHRCLIREQLYGVQENSVVYIQCIRFKIERAECFGVLVVMHPIHGFRVRCAGSCLPISNGSWQRISRFCCRVYQMREDRPDFIGKYLNGH